MERKILVVDDDPDILNFIGLELSNNGFAATLCNNVPEAIEMLKLNSFECAILDIVMGPDQTTDEVVKFLKNTSVNILNFDLPMIIVSAHVNEELSKRMLSRDPLIVDVIKKPFKKNQLSSKIKEILNTQGIVDEELDIMFRPFKDSDEEVARQKQIRLDKQKEEEQSKRSAMEKVGISEIMYHCFLGDFDSLQNYIINNPDEILMERSLDGKTPLHYAARGGNTQLVDFLLSRNLKINERDKKGRECLYEALKNQDVKMCKHLISKGARVISKIGDQTYLMIAASLNNIELFELFLQSGVNISATDDEGKTVMAHLNFRKQTDFLALIKKYR